MDRLDDILIEDWPHEELEGDPQELLDLRETLRLAVSFLEHWLDGPRVVTARFDSGFSKVAVFEMRTEQDPNETRRYWVIAGDLPHLAVEVRDAPTSSIAVQQYCEVMRRWVGRVREGLPVDDLPPVLTTKSWKPVQALEDRADDLESRLDFIETVLFES